MPIFDNLQRCSFGGVKFPIKTLSIRGRYRHHMHEYLRVPGAVIEKLERAQYDIEIDAVFDTNIKGFGTLWPNGVNSLRSKYENGITADLVIPTIGTIPAFQPTWSQHLDMARVRSGETVRLNFVEDQTAKFLKLAVVQTQQASMSNALDQFNITRAQIIGEPANDTNLFDTIVGAATGVLALKDQADLYGGLLTAKVERLTGLMNQADTALESLKHPQNHELIDAFLALWDSGVMLATNLAETPRGPRTYTTPRLMSVADIAAAPAVYGDATRANDILLNNRLDDPFAVTAGTKIVYFVNTGLAA